MTPSASVAQRFVPALRIANLTRRVYVADLPTWILEVFRQLDDLTGSRRAGGHLVIYHGAVNTDNDGPAEVCTPFTGSLTVPEGVSVREEPAHHEAFMTLTRAQFEFPNILLAYDATCAFAQAHGRSSFLSLREVYCQVDGEASRAEDLVDDVAWPFIPARREES
ncbi:hypothetical protein [Deinococcus malanensis]|nr:hypothetical protein [Deinococcus malanensis]